MQSNKAIKLVVAYSAFLDSFVSQILMCVNQLDHLYRSFQEKDLAELQLMLWAIAFYV